MPTSRPVVAVIGAGPAGLAAAHELVGAGIRVDVFERGTSVGGLARSLDLWGERVELGPHVLAGGDADALALWNSVAGRVRELPLRRALWRGGRTIEYPPTPASLLRDLSAAELLRGAVGAARARLSFGGDEPADARRWFEARYGRALYDLLLHGYIGKLWGRDGTEIDASYLAAVAGAAQVRTERRAAGNRLQHPIDGLGSAWARLVGRLAASGKLFLETPVDGIMVENRVAVGLRTGGRERRYDAVLSTAPVRALLGMLAGVPDDVRRAADSLETRHILLVHLRARVAPLRHAWMFVDDPALAIGRVSDSRYWQGSARPDGVLALEYWCGDSDAVWREDDATIASRATRELRASVCPALAVDDWRVTRIRGALPVPLVGYRTAATRVEEHLRGVAGLESMGRHGSFVFDSTISGMADGIRAARRTLTRLRTAARIPAGAA